MSVELIREMNDAVERRDLQAVADLFHPDAVWEHNPGGGSPEEGVYKGREQIEGLFHRIVEGFEYMYTQAAEVRE